MWQVCAVNEHTPIECNVSHATTAIKSNLFTPGGLIDESYLKLQLFEKFAIKLDLLSVTELNWLIRWCSQCPPRIPYSCSLFMMFCGN